jgi:chemotaxis protein MotB
MDIQDSRITRRRAFDQANESHERWLISYADLVTLLLALFVTLFAATDQKRATTVASAVASQFGLSKQVTPSKVADPATAKQASASDSVSEAQTAIERVFAANGALHDRSTIRVTERGIVISLTEAGFFAPADEKIRGDALPLLDTLAQALKQSDAAVRVEGHTDSTPISTPRFHSNWELSAARAVTVLQCLADRGVLTNRLSVAGYAAEQPVADNSTAAGRALNRRVDLVILKSNQ